MAENLQRDYPMLLNFGILWAVLADGELMIASYFFTKI